MNSLVDPIAHRRALRGEPRRGRHRAHRSRHLLPAAAGAGRLRPHPRRYPSSTATWSTRACSRSTTAAQPEVFLASADWMPRNLDHRIEIAFPLVDPVLRQRCGLPADAALRTTVKARIIGPDGRSHRVPRGSRPAVRAQDRAYELLETPGLSAAPTASTHEVPARTTTPNSPPAPAREGHATAS